MHTATKVRCYRVVLPVLIATLLLSQASPGYGAVRKAEARRQLYLLTPNYIFPNEVYGHGLLLGGTENVVETSAGIEGDLIIRNRTAVWLSINAVIKHGRSSFSSDDVFVDFGVLPPQGTVTYRGTFAEIDDKITVYFVYDFNAWLWNTADTLLRIAPGGSALSGTALGTTLHALTGLNAVRDAAQDLQAIQRDGIASLPIHGALAAYELSKIAGDDAQLLALHSILTGAGLQVGLKALQERLVVPEIYKEIKHIVHSIVFLTTVPSDASIAFEASYHVSPPAPVPPLGIPTPRVCMQT